MDNNEYSSFKKMKPIDLSKELRRHPTKQYKVRKDLAGIKRIVIHTSDRNWTIDQLVKYDVDGQLTYWQELEVLPDGSVNAEERTEVNQISATGLPAVTYHDIIMSDGTIYHTLPYREISWHAGGYNTASLAVALMYGCTDPITKRDTYGPTAKALKSLQCHLGVLCLDLGLTPDKIVGHRELQGTGWFLNSQGSKRLRKTCPGMQVNLDELRANIAKYMQVQLKLAGIYTGEVDGLFGKRSIAALSRYRRK